MLYHYYLDEHYFPANNKLTIDFNKLLIMQCTLAMDKINFLDKLIKNWEEYNIN